MVRRNTIGNTAEEINLDFLHEQLLLAMKKIKISDQEWFDQAIGDLMLSDQCCPYCGAKSSMKPHDSYSRYMVT